LFLETRRNNLTIKQERFAQEYVATGNASEAYRRAYDTHGSPETVAREAHALVTHPKVAPRIEELRAEISVWASLDRSAIAAELAENRLVALARGQVAAANRATKLLGDMIGAFD
jgi:hypothetical protein